MKADAIRVIKTPFLNKIPILKAKLHRLAASETVNKEELKHVKKLLKEAQTSLTNIE